MKQGQRRIRTDQKQTGGQFTILRCVSRAARLLHATRPPNRETVARGRPPERETVARARTSAETRDCCTRPDFRTARLLHADGHPSERLLHAPERAPSRETVARGLTFEPRDCCPQTTTRARDCCTRRASRGGDYCTNATGHRGRLLHPLRQAPLLGAPPPPRPVLGRDERRPSMDHLPRRTRGSPVGYLPPVTATL